MVWFMEEGKKDYLGLLMGRISFRPVSLLGLRTTFGPDLFLRLAPQPRVVVVPDTSPPRHRGPHISPSPEHSPEPPPEPSGKGRQ